MATAPACITRPIISTTRPSSTAPPTGSGWSRTRWQREGLAPPEILWREAEIEHFPLAVFVRRQCGVGLTAFQRVDRGPHQGRPLRGGAGFDQQRRGGEPAVRQEIRPQPDRDLVVRCDRSRQYRAGFQTLAKSGDVVVGYLGGGGRRCIKVLAWTRGQSEIDLVFYSEIRLRRMPGCRLRRHAGDLRGGLLDGRLRNFGRRLRRLRLLPRRCGFRCGRRVADGRVWNFDRRVRDRGAFLYGPVG